MIAQTRSVQLADGRTIDVQPPSDAPNVKGKRNDDDKWWLALLLITAADIHQADAFWRLYAGASFAGMLQHTGGWSFNGTSQQYTKNDKPQDEDESRAIYLAFLARATADIEKQATQMARGKVPLADWQSTQAKAIKSLYIASDALGRGGSENVVIDEADSEAPAAGENGLTDAIRDAMDRLNRFGQQLEAGSGGASVTGIVRRAGLYAGPAHGVFELARRESHKDATDENGNVITWEELNVLGNADHCTSTDTTIGCVECAGAGWQPLGHLPMPGERTCGPQCKCYMAYRVAAPNKLSDVKPEHFSAGVKNSMAMSSGRTVQLSDGRTVRVLALADDAEGDWVTINGAHVLIKDGVVSKGPHHLVGKTVEQVRSHGKAAPADGAKDGYHRIERNAKGDYVGTHTANGIEHNPEHAERIKKLKISPGYSKIHLAEDPAAMRQAYQTDQKSREGRVYSAEHHQKQKAAKFARVKAFVKKLPGIREAIVNHPSEEAGVLRLIDQTGIRIGSERDTGADKKAFGASTLKSEHVVTSPEGKTSLSFVGKKGVQINQEISDKGLSSEIKDRAKSGGKLYNTTAEKVRDHLHGIAPGFKVKDFRTAVAADTAMKAMKEIQPPASPAELTKARNQVGKVVAAKLGNTPDVALKSYIPPEVFSDWEAKAGSVEKATKGSTDGKASNQASARKSKSLGLSAVGYLRGRANRPEGVPDVGDRLRSGRRGPEIVLFGGGTISVLALSGSHLARCPNCKSFDVTRKPNMVAGRSLDRCKRCGHAWSNRPGSLTA